MIWIASSEKDTAAATLERRLLDTADEFRANSGLKAQEYSDGGPLGLLGISFLRFAAKRAQLESPSPLGGERAGVRGESHPRPADGRGVGGEGITRDRDAPGLCKAATLNEIEAQGRSFNPGRYVGVAPGQAVSDEDFNAAARELEATIASNVTEIVEA